MSGILYGVGVGPGDPELMTLKAVRLIRENQVIAVPGEEAEASVAYKIAVQAVPELAEKKLIPVSMPMTHDKEELRNNHQKAADQLEQYLIQGKNVVFLTLGDPTIYSTYLYVQRILEKKGYDTRLVSGIPSFCAAAARLNIPLVELKETLHVVPAFYGFTEEELKRPGNFVFMKSGKRMGQVKEALLESGKDVMMVENCGMENEKIYGSADEIPENAGYYSLIIAKERK